MFRETAIVTIVDDDVAARRAMARLLAAHGFGVKQFSSAEQYWNSTEASEAVCVLIDIDLGDGMSGLELGEAIRRSPYALPIVFMTGSPQSTLRARAFELGAVAFFEKPVRGDELIAVIRRLREVA